MDEDKLHQAILEGINEFVQAGLVIPLSSYERIEDGHMILCHMIVCYFIGNVEMDPRNAGSFFWYPQLCKTTNFCFFSHPTLMSWAFIGFSCKI